VLRSTTSGTMKSMAAPGAGSDRPETMSAGVVCCINHRDSIGDLLKNRSLNG
jgi:hypothetical protein